MRFTIFVVAAAVFSQVVLAIPLTPEDSDGSIKFLKTDVTDVTFRNFQTSGSNEVQAQPNVTLPNRSNQIDATQEENVTLLIMFAGKGCKSIYKTFSVLDHIAPHKCVEADSDLTLQSALLYQGNDVGLFVPVFVGDKCGGKFWQVSDINKCLDTPVPYTVFKVD